jgi:alanine racemase
MSDGERIEPVVPVRPGRPRVWAEIDVGTFQANLRRARSLAPRGRVIAVLKADAYGHGAVALAAASLEAGAVALAVGDSTEALRLRRAGFAAPILVLGALAESEIASVVAEGILPVINSEGRCVALEAEARRQGRRLPVHLKVDTGMGRFGVLPSRAPALARRIHESPHLSLEGLMSHLAGPVGSAANAAQARLFEDVVLTLAAEGLRPPEIHLRNTSGLLDPAPARPFETAARVGAGLYGFAPGPRPGDYPFDPVLALRAQVIFLKDLPAGFPVGYGGAQETGGPTRIGILPIGYADGWRRALQGRGTVLLRGQRAPHMGQISMDYATLDLTRIPGVEVGDVATLIGRDGAQEIRIEDVAEASGTIAYEVACGLGARVARVPVRDAVPSGAA